MKEFGKLIAKILLLVIGYMLIGIISGKISGSGRLFVMTYEEQMAAGKASILVAFCFSAILLYIANRSKWRGIKLIGVLFLVQFGINGFLTQIESFVYLDQLVTILPKGSLSILVLANLINAILFSPLVVLVAGKIKGYNEKIESTRLQMKSAEWLIKIALLGVAYYFIYTQFGMHVMVPIAGQEAFSSYYKDLQMPSWMPIFQFIRGVIWVGIALPVIAMFKGGKIETAIAVGLLFSILMGINLIVPLPFMPDQIRFAHLVEVMTSNFTYGLLVVYVILWKRKKAKTA